MNRGDAELPSAEPVAWGIWHSNGDLVGLKMSKWEADKWCGDSATYGPPRPLYTTPSAAAQDTARLDWLEAHSSKYYSAIEMDHNAPLGDGATLREAIDNALDAARAATLETP